MGVEVRIIIGIIGSVAIVAFAIFMFKEKLYTMGGTIMIYVLGAALNIAAVLANGLKMPVFTNDPSLVASLLDNPRHCLANSSTKLQFFCDRIDFGLLFRMKTYYHIWSAGDIFLFVIAPLGFMLAAIYEFRKLRHQGRSF